jgi:hypothetical protein
LSEPSDETLREEEEARERLREAQADAKDTLEEAEQLEEEAGGGDDVERPA